MAETPVTELMTEPVMTVEPDERPADVARAMVEKSIKSIVVIDGDCRPVGILTSTDYVQMTADGTDPHETTVEEWMTRDVLTATIEESIRTAADRMVSNGITHLPVVEDDRVVGLVSSTDLAAYLAEE